MLLLFKRVLVFSSIYLFSIGFTFANQLDLYLFTQKANVGDRNQILGLAQVISEAYQQGPVQVKEVQFLNEDLTNLRKSFLKEFEYKHQNGDRLLALTVGESGIDVVQQLAGIKNLKILHVSHQIFDRHSELIDKADWVMLPSHAITEKDKRLFQASQTQLLLTIGVFHHLTRIEIEQAYLKYQALIPSSKSFIAVILAGDAPTPDGKMRYFEKSEAEKLARWVSARAKKKGSTILVLNGPRTGKFDPKSGQLQDSVHQNNVIDPITQAFINKLNSYVSSKRVVLFDFQYNQISHYKTVLGLLKKTRDCVLVPGESTSMISETIGLLPGQVIVYENNAMNSVHHLHLKSEFEAGRISMLTKSSKLIPRKEELKTMNSIISKEVIQSVLLK